MSQKVAVIYQSKAGYTEKYAKWIAKALKCDVMKATKVGVKTLESYDTIIYGGGIYVGKINGLDLIKKHYDALKEKHIVIFATGASSGKKEELNKVWENNLTLEQRNKIETFYLRGGFDFSKLGVIDKFLMMGFKQYLKKNKDTDEEAREMLEAYHKPIDFTMQENIKPLIQLINSF